MKSIYRIIDSNGRIYIPRKLRDSAELDCGDVLELRSGKGKIILSKVKIAPPEPTTVDDILEMLEAVPKSALFEAAAKLTALIGGEING